MIEPTLETPKIALLGAGGMAQEVIKIIKLFGQYEIEYLYDNTIQRNKQLLGYQVSPHFSSSSKYIMAVGYPETKQKILQSIKKQIQLAPVISFHSSSNDIIIGDGSVIHNVVVLTTDIQIGICSTINSMVTIGHGCRIGDLFHASAGVTISGNNVIGDRVFMGANSCTREKISICNDVIIGAGSVVVRDITEPGKYAGNPAKKISRREELHG